MVEELTKQNNVKKKEFFFWNNFLWFKRFHVL